MTDGQENRSIKITIMAYSREESHNIYRLFSAATIGENIEINQSLLKDKENVDTDIAVVYLGPTDSYSQYTNDISFLTIIREVPEVFAVVCEGRSQEVNLNKGEIATDDIIYLPISTELLRKHVMTHVALIKMYESKLHLNGNGNTHHLGEILVEHKIITPLQLKKAIDIQKGTSQYVGEILVSQGYISEEQKMHFLASQQNVEIAKPKQFASADLNVVALIPEIVARQHHCVALEKNKNELVVAMLDVTDLHLLDKLRDITDLNISPIYALESEIKESVDHFYKDIVSQQNASDLIADLGDDVEFLNKEDEDLSSEEAAAAGAELGIVKLVNLILSNAIRDRASDVHVEPMEHELTVRYRIDGELKKVMSPPHKSHQAIVTRIKILSKLNIAERRLPQDGQMVVRIDHHEVDIRVSILPSVFGEKVVLRILDKDAFDINVENLGFSQNDIQVFRSNVSKPHGMVIVTGPTGSGKSTTLYSAIQTIKDVSRNIITVEDPVEFHISGVTQVNVLSNIGLTFGAALRSILRQDPDVILIGEIRDSETADIAIKMALTGHQVFSTLHTNDAAGTIDRFLDIGVPPLLLTSCINLVIAQRLVKKICKNCKVEYTPEEEIVQMLNLPDGNGVKLYRGAGCVACNGTGYAGRMGIFEMMNISPAIRKMILKGESSVDIKEQALKEGMQTLRVNGIEKAIKGETTIEQILAVTMEI